MSSVADVTVQWGQHAEGAADAAHHPSTHSAQVPQHLLQNAGELP